MEDLHIKIRQLWPNSSFIEDKASQSLRDHVFHYSISSFHVENDPFGLIMLQDNAHSFTCTGKRKDVQNSELFKDSEWIFYDNLLQGSLLQN